MPRTRAMYGVVHTIEFVIGIDEEHRDAEEELLDSLDELLTNSGVSVASWNTALLGIVEQPAPHIARIRAGVEPPPGYTKTSTLVPEGTCGECGGVYHGASDCD